MLFEKVDGETFEKIMRDEIGEEVFAEENLTTENSENSENSTVPDSENSTFTDSENSFTIYVKEDTENTENKE
jgi:hypothetical protein